MAKRELIDRIALREEIYTTTEWNGDVHRIVYERSLDDAKEITEEEIVKPYLEKLSKEISEVYEDDEYDGYDPNALGRFEERVQELIDSLLTEKGAEE